MQMYQCPNCGRTYSEFQNVYYCGNCNYKLLKQEDIKNINNPELSKREYKVIGKVIDPTKPQNTNYSTQTKLQELEQIYKNNLITQEEYENKRKEIINKF